jgi:dipeptidyl aminopeptidase/acylaminoacyl peptidase
MIDPAVRTPRRLALALSLLAIALPAQAASIAPPTAAALASAPAISDVSISPDGQHLVAVTSPDGEATTISIWRTDEPQAKPYVLGSGHMRFLSVRFLKNDRLLATGVQPWTYGSTATHVIKQFVMDLQGNGQRTLLPESRATQSAVESFVDNQSDAQIISTLPLDPQNVIVEDNRLESAGDVDKVNVYTGEVERLIQGSERFFDFKVDLKGQVRAKSELNFDNGKVYIAQWLKNPDTGVWEELFRSYAKDRSLSEIVGFTDDPHVVFVSSAQGGDKTGIFEYDVAQRKFIEPAFQHKLFEAENTVLMSKAPADYGRPLGFAYQAETSRVYWLDDHLQALSEAIDKALGVTSSSVQWTDPGTGVQAPIDVETGASASLLGWSDDLKYVLVEKSGPAQPPEYYLLTDGSQLSLLGKSRPWIDPASLGNTRLVEYPARDGLMIPAFLTLPPSSFGPGPFPTLIEPHGGPWARDDMEWDIAGWVQYFASRGYAVLQPQFRGSEGWGQKLWRAGDGEWGQKMQDDNDDGVKWLIGQKLADPKRVAMFGYSYGGYAALAASIRPNGLYQCAVSGAGAGDLGEISRATFDNRFQREFQHPTIGGLDALAHAKEAQIPVLLYHGDRDQTVDIEQSRKFAAALRGAGKPVKLVEIKDMGHQYIFMTPPMLLEQLTLVDDFLKTDCKPGGL